MAATPAARPSSRACRLPTSGRSRCRLAADEQVLFLSDIFPTGYMAAENCQIKPGDTIAVWGCGPVGQFAIQSAYLLGAERVIAIDRFPERLALASTKGKAEVLNYAEVDVPEALRDLTGGQGPDACIDAVGLESHGTTLDAWYDRAKTSMYLATDRPHALRQAIGCCRKGGTVSIPGVYGGWLDKFPLGAAFAKGLTLKMGQTHMHKYMPLLLDRIERGEIDPVVHHHAPRHARRCAGDVPDVPREAGRLHQGGHEARATTSSRTIHDATCNDTGTKETAMAEAGTLHDAFIDELRDTYDAEKQLTKALPKLAKAATSPELRAGVRITSRGDARTDRAARAGIREPGREGARQALRRDGRASSRKASRSWKRTSTTPPWTRA